MEVSMDPGESIPDQRQPADRPTAAVAESQPEGETRGARFARGAHRTGLYVYAGLAVALLVVLIALVIANTGRVQVSWVVGSASVSLVWLVIFSAILGLLLGMVLGALFRWRTRAPRK
ncbi:MAG: DUF1049 domain-containing protein [Thermoleophilaceae bacterium]|nr:DUF1049 domain-containing protein [Thermoleophilaceae bacterium]